MDGGRRESRQDIPGDHLLRNHHHLVEAELRRQSRKDFEPIDPYPSHWMIVRPLRLAVAPGPVDDSGLVLRIQGDDEAAFRELYLRHAAYVARVVYRLMGDDADVDDIVQDTFVDAADGIATVHEPGSIRRWLVVIAVRRVRRTLVRRRRRRWFGGQMAEMAPRASDPADRRLVDELYDALGRLPDEMRIPWVLARVEQQPLKDVAEACAVSLATVKRRLVEADDRLERKLKDE